MTWSWHRCCCYHLTYFALLGVAIGYDYLRLNFRDPLINAQTVCGNIRGLTREQLQLCSQDPFAVASALQGMKRAIHECKIQFENERWNCSVMESRDLITYTCPFLTRGFRETAFSFAVASAGVTHAVAHACSLGKIRECACPTPRTNQMTASQRKRFRQKHWRQTQQHDQQQLVQKFERSGCDHNVNFGMEFSSKFLDYPDESNDMLATIRQHNNRVGRLIVAHNMREECKCHGTSGACNLKTCWNETPDFRAVAKAIKEKYQKAVIIGPRSGSNRVTEISNDIYDHMSTARTQHHWDTNDLVFFEESPSFCNPNPNIEHHGTAGRYCNSSLPRHHPGSCEHMCCGRGYETFTVQRQTQCNCTFHWCCYVKCQDCNSTQRISVCM